MTTTSSFQFKPDYYNTKEECVKDVKAKSQTNPRYKGFTQRQFTAGDEEQFQAYRDPTNGQVCIPDINLDHNLFKNLNLDLWYGYKDLKTPDVLNTFRYIFNKFKKGIFVKIKEGELKVFLPFSKSNFTNEWGDKIKVNPKEYKSTDDFLRHVSKMQGYKFFPNKVHQDTKKWYGNNCLVRFENPISEGDSNVSNVKNMLEELCEQRKVPDIEFFINRRDFPLLTRDGTEPYDGIWGSENTPLVSHNYKKFVPILSMSKTDRYADVLNPTWDDWARVQKDIWFPNTCKEYDNDFSTPWDKKKDLAVFRGGSTGCGTTIEDNMRLKIAEMTGKFPEHLDAGITNWNLRPRKKRTEKYLQTIHPHELNFDLVSRMSTEQQSKYKYIVHIQGHVAAFRLSVELGMGSVILYVENPWKIWYTDMLKPYQHYVPVKKDLSDLIDRINWCKNHQKECQEIAQNAKEFYNTYLQKDGILDYMQKTVVDLKDKMGVYLYNSQTPLKAVIENIESKSNNWPYHNFPVAKEQFAIHKIPNMGRSYGLLQGVEWLIQFLENSVLKIADSEGQIFRNKLGQINKYTLAGFPLVAKSTSDPQKKLEHIHEGFLGTRVLNNLAKEIPNFVYIFNEVEGNVVIEYIKGESMDKYISSNRFNMNEFTLILAQLCLALKIAQDKYGFVHWDLKPWNIMIQRFSKPKTFDYAISMDEIYRVKTEVIPVIIDYGKSHVVYNNVHHGFINPYKFSTVQDIVTLLVTSVHQILTEKTLSKSDFSNLLNISDFISGTSYRRDKFSSAKDLKEFTQEAKRYANLIGSNMGNLEKKNCMDMLKHLMKINPVTVSRTEKYSNSMNKGNAQQVFEYIFLSDKQARLNTYKDVFVRLMNSTLPQPSSKFFMYYAAQTIEANIKSVWVLFKKFLERESISINYYEKTYNNILDFLRQVYLSKIEKMKPNKIKWKEYQYEELPEYTEDIFSMPKKVRNLIVPYKDEKFRHDILPVFLYRGEFEMTASDREFYTKNLAGYIKYTRDNWIKLADVKTLAVVSELLYKPDLAYLEQKIENEIGNCEKAEEMIDEYSKVIKHINELT